MLLEGLCPLPSAWLAAPGKAGALTVSLMRSQQSVQLGQKNLKSLEGLPFQLGRIQEFMGSTY